MGAEGRALVANLTETRTKQGFRGQGVTHITRCVTESGWRLIAPRVATGSLPSTNGKSTV